MWTNRLCGKIYKRESSACVCVCQRFTLSCHKMGFFPPGPALSHWLDAHFLCVLLLFTVDFLCAKMGEHLANTQYG